METTEESADSRRFAQNLEALMSHRGMTQPALEAASGVPQTTISRMLRSGSPTSNNHLRIARALSCDMEALYLDPEALKTLMIQCGNNPISIPGKYFPPTTPRPHTCDDSASARYSDTFLLFRSRIHGSLKILPNGEAIETDSDKSNGLIIAGKYPGVTAYLVRGDGLTPAIRDGYYILVRNTVPCQPEQLCLVTLVHGAQMIRELTFERDDSMVFSHPVDAKIRESIPRSTILHISPIVGVIHKSELSETA